MPNINATLTIDLSKKLKLKLDNEELNSFKIVFKNSSNITEDSLKNIVKNYLNELPNFVYCSTIENQMIFIELISIFCNMLKNVKSKKIEISLDDIKISLILSKDYMLPAKAIISI